MVVHVSFKSILHMFYACAYMIRDIIINYYLFTKREKLCNDVNILLTQS